MRQTASFIPEEVRRDREDHEDQDEPAYRNRYSLDEPQVSWEYEFIFDHGHTRSYIKPSWLN